MVKNFASMFGGTLGAAIALLLIMVVCVCLCCAALPVLQSIGQSVATATPVP